MDSGVVNMGHKQKMGCKYGFWAVYGSHKQPKPHDFTMTCLWARKMGNLLHMTSMEPIFGPLSAIMCWHGLHMTWAMGFHGTRLHNELYFLPFHQLGPHYPVMFSILMCILSHGHHQLPHPLVQTGTFQAGALGGGRSQVDNSSHLCKAPLPIAIQTRQLQRPCLPTSQLGRTGHCQLLLESATRKCTSRSTTATQ